MSHLKDWAQAVYGSNRDFSAAISDRANQLIDGLLAVTGLPEPPGLDRHKLASLIATIILNRSGWFAVARSPGQVTARAKQAKKIANAVTKLDKALLEGGLSGIRFFKQMYECSIRCECGRTPTWDVLSIGLIQLQLVANAQKSRLEMERLAARGGNLEFSIAGPIADCYRQTFGTDAAVSRDPSTNTPGGPFVRFARFLERETNPVDEPPAALETVVSALRRSRAT